MFIISTYTPHVPLSRIGWLQQITEEQLSEFSPKSEALIGLKHPTKALVSSDKNEKNFLPISIST